MEKKMAMILMIAAVAAVSILVCVTPGSDASVDPEDETAGGSISWMLVSSSLVLLMIPGLILFYGGLLRKQSMSAMIAQSMGGAAVVGLLWVVCGYSLAFGGDGTFGDFSRLFMDGAIDTASGGNISELEFAMYQMMFAMIAPCLFLGACAERMRFQAVIAYMAAWSILIYAPLVHFVWDGGFSSMFGDWFQGLDFAGGIAIHLAAAMAGVVAVRFLGPRKEHIRKLPSHNIPMVFLGTGILVVGWMGFNGGGFGTADSYTIHAVINTIVAWLGSTVTWMIIQYSMYGRVSTVGICTGLLAGLVAITPCAGYVGIPASIFLGICGSVVGYYAISYFHSLKKFDDALDVFALHGCVTMFGLLALGFLADPAVVGEEAEGLIYGGFSLLASQIVMVLFTVVYSSAISYVILKVISLFIRVSVTPEEQDMGQDIIEHGERAYQ
ncbi:MAG: ammonium transporter [Thermoplasmata archaeon]|nr:ammonium transporter [Thermoplasmata archaeon]